MERNRNIPRRNPTRATKSKHRFSQPLASSSNVQAHSSVILPLSTRSPSPQSATTSPSRQANSSVILPLTPSPHPATTSPSTGNRVSKPKIVSVKPKFIRFRFQLDCSAAEGVDVDELVNFLNVNMKIDGKKKNLSEVAITRRNANVEIMAKVMVKKKYLKLLAKKFLQKKKLSHYRVIQKNKRSYKMVQKTGTQRTSNDS